MPDFLLILRDIVLLRRGPQDLPFAPRLLGAVILIDVALSALMENMLGVGVGEGVLLRNAAGTGLGLGVLYLLLYAKQFQARFTQAGLALLLVSVVYTGLLVIVLTVLGLPPAPDTKPEAVTGVQLVTMLVFIALSLWRLAVDASVLRHALEIRYLLALPLVLALHFSVSVLVIALFGASAPPATGS